MPRTITDTIGALADPGSDSDERAQLRAVLARMIAEVAPPERVRELDENEEFDHELHKQLAAMGILALGGSPEDGGYGDGRDQLVAVEELAAGPTSTAVFLIVHYMAVQILSTCASAAQRETVLTPLMSGEVKVSFALTEAGGGTDVARAMRTRAERTADGWRLTGSKTWISGAQICDYLVVLARTAPLTESSIDGITMFLVPRDTPGVQVRELPTVAVHGYDTNEVRFDDVILPANAVVGEVDSGFRQVIAVLNRERLNAAAGAVGAARGALEASVRYATEREAFGKHLGTMQAVQHRLVDGALAIEAARSLMIRAAEIEAAGGRADILSSMAKIVASEAAVKVTQDGMLMFAGAGFSREFPIQRWFRDVRLWTFAPLTNDMARNYLGERYLGLGRSY